MDDNAFNKVVHSSEACTDCSNNGRNYCNDKLCTVDNTLCKNYPDARMSPTCTGPCEISYT
jgi:hypothetical protein